MINTLQELKDLLANTFLADRQMAEIPILDTSEKAFAVQISSSEVETAWKVARDLLPQTERWPIVSIFWLDNLSSSWEEQLLDQDYFSRNEFHLAPNPSDVSPAGLISASEQVDPAQMLRELWTKRDGYTPDLEEVLTFELEETSRCYGNAPTIEDIQNATINGERIKTRSQLERWLFDWETQQPGDGKPELARQEWFTQDPSVLLFLPTSNSWETLAYINWFGTQDYGSEYYIALGRKWAERYGAELVAHYGTMLEYFVSNPPTTLEDAWELANEQDLVAPCTLLLPGISVRHHARGLLNDDRWFLHERP